MKSKRWKNAQIKENDIIKSFFIILFVAIFLLIYINNTYLQFWFNDFSEIFKSELQVYCLDVGQASSTLLVLPNKMTMLIDTGSGESERQLLKNVETILQENKIENIDYLVLSHPDEDHVGGAEAILDRYQVNRIFRPTVLSTSVLEVENDDFATVTTTAYAKTITAVYNEPNCVVDFIEDISFFMGDELYIKFWPAKEKTYSQTNAYSPFIMLQYIGKTFLFACDATAEREQEFIDDLVSQNIEIVADYLFVAHHGSKYSSTTEFLEFVSPKVALISAGDNLHPSYEVLERLQNVGTSNVYVTKNDGTIGIGIGHFDSQRIKTLSNYLDLPFYFVMFSCVLFCYMKFCLNGCKKKFNFTIKT